MPDMSQTLCSAPPPCPLLGAGGPDVRTTVSRGFFLALVNTKHNVWTNMCVLSSMWHLVELLPCWHGCYYANSVMTDCLMVAPGAYVQFILYVMSMVFTLQNQPWRFSPTVLLSFLYNSSIWCLDNSEDILDAEILLVDCSCFG
ncbi:hypothetical protein GOP47_0012944, partial [Adiantum capillus-veneris]